MRLCVMCVCVCVCVCVCLDTHLPHERIPAAVSGAGLPYLYLTFIHRLCGQTHTHAHTYTHTHLSHC